MPPRTIPAALGVSLVAALLVAGAAVVGVHDDAEHADQDNVFTQFYPILRGAESKNSLPH